MFTSGAPQTTLQSSERYYGGELAKKTSSRTQDAQSQRRERRFTELLQFLMPVYLLPFVFGNAEGVGIYCVLMTLVWLTGSLLPPAVAAFLPLVILPMAGIYAADQLAAEFIGPRVLAAWMMFAIAIVGDETSVFARACLHALQRFALRTQPLFLSLQLVVLALSLFLPSSLIVVFGTVLIERFFAIVQRELVTVDQRSGLRALTSSSTQNFMQDVRRQRRQRRVAAGGNYRRARSVSMASDTTMASEGSRSSSLVRQYKLHPEWLKERGFEAQKKAVRKLPQKTSFDPFEHTSDGVVLACRLPTRTIRSFSPQNMPPSSILKGGSSKGKEPEPETPSQRKATPTTTDPVKFPNPAAAIPKNRQSDLRTNVVHTVKPADKVSSGLSSTPSSEHSKKAKCEPANKASVTYVDDPVIELSVVEQTTRLPADETWRGSARPAELAPTEDDVPISPGDESPGEMQFQQMLSALPTSTTPMTPSTSPFSLSGRSSVSSSPRAVVDVWNTATLAAGGERSLDSYAAWTSHMMSGPCSRLLLHGEEAGTASPLARSSESTTLKSAAEEQQQPSPPASVATENSRSVVKWDTALGPQIEDDASGWKLLQVFQGLHMQTAIEVSQLQKAPSHPNSRSERLLEVRGVLKATHSSASLQPSPRGQRESPTTRRLSLTSMDHDTSLAATLNSGLATRRPIMCDSARRRAAGRNENGTDGRRIVIASQTYHDAASSFLDSGDEQVSSSIRLRALILAVRPVFIAGTAYTAIFGNLISFNTLPARHAVLVNLGCNADQCAVGWWSWAAVALPVALACCLVCWVYAYFASLASSDDEIEEQTHADMSNCARVRLRTMKRHTVRETLLIYWLIGIPLTYGAYVVRHPESYLEGPLFGLCVVGMSMMPGLTCTHYWSHRMLCWSTICSRMPWNVVIMCGCIMALTRVVERYRLVQTLLDQLDDQFWKGRSAKANQFILSSMAALLSEMIVGDTLGEVLTPVVVRVVAYGVFLKCTAVIVIVTSMNTLGTIFFDGETLANNQVAAVSIVNATHLGAGWVQ
ncbi:uncharacterized protein [Dermacentor albipictus]|uniref:uncharacterized protein isoform X3 n=1 Tax=Dermacentor albipictus TaxID=60249 RepID=UPI0031FBDCA8